MITCPICKKPHQEYWWVLPSGKRSLCYDCKRVPVMKKIGTLPDGKDETKLTYSTKRLNVLPDVASKYPAIGKNCEERWSKKWARKQQDAAQMQFPETPPEGCESHELALIDREIADAMAAKEDAELKLKLSTSVVLGWEKKLQQLGKRRSELATLKLL